MPDMKKSQVVMLCTQNLSERQKIIKVLLKRIREYEKSVAKSCVLRPRLASTAELQALSRDLQCIGLSRLCHEFRILNQTIFKIALDCRALDQMLASIIYENLKSSLHSCQLIDLYGSYRRLHIGSRTLLKLFKMVPENIIMQLDETLQEIKKGGASALSIRTSMKMLNTFISETKNYLELVLLISIDIVYILNAKKFSNQ